MREVSHSFVVKTPKQVEKVMAIYLAFKAIRVCDNRRDARFFERYLDSILTLRSENVFFRETLKRKKVDKNPLSPTAWVDDRHKHLPKDLKRHLMEIYLDCYYFNGGQDEGGVRYMKCFRKRYYFFMLLGYLFTLYRRNIGDQCC